jgi:hypothetical protein
MLFVGLFLRHFLRLTAIGLGHIQKLCEISAFEADRAMRSALAACFRKNLVSFTIAQPNASASGRIGGQPKRQVQKVGQASRRR